MATEALTEERIRTLALSQRHLPWGIGSRSEDAIQFARAIEAEVRAALASAPAAEPVAEVIEISMLGINSPPGKMIQSLSDIPVGTKLYAAPQPAEPAQPAPQAGAADVFEAARTEANVSPQDFVRGAQWQKRQAYPTEQPSQDAALLDWLETDGWGMSWGEDYVRWIVTGTPSLSLRQNIAAARAAQAQGEKGKA